MTQTTLRDVRPIREGLIQLDPPALLGSTCQACSTSVFPAREFCPSCLADGPHPVRALAPNGSVFSYTVVHQAPPGRRTPYVLGLVDLEVDKVRVMAQIDVPVDQVHIGMPVSLILREVSQNEGTSIVNYAFSASSSSTGEKQ